MRILAVSVTLALTVACKPAQDRIPIDSGTRVDTATLARFTVAQFQQLRWLDGRWQGFMSNGNKFYEQYRFLNDSTILKHGFPDSTFAKASDSSHVQLRNGLIADESVASRYVATRLDSTGVDFAPQRGATNHFTWARESPTKWNATLRWTDKDGRPQSVVYALHKMGR
jgi:nucleoside-specific outer membrane channel protein Tsx